MNDMEDLGPGGKTAFGAACVVCCAVPMLVVLGVLSVGAALTGGVTLGAAAGVAGLTWAVASRRVAVTPPVWRYGAVAAGLALTAVGLSSGAAGETQRAVLAAGVGLLAAAALLALGAARGERVS